MQLIQMQRESTDEKKMLAGGVVVHNSHLVSDKLLYILEQILDMEDFKGEHGLFNIVFDADGLPTDDGGKRLLYGEYDQHSRSIVLNLYAIIEDVISHTLGTGSEVSLKAFYWHAVIYHFLHEIHHSWAYEVVRRCKTDRDMLIDNWSQEEREAKEWADEAIIHLAKTVDVEPPEKMDDMPFFNHIIAKTFYIAMNKEKTAENLGWVEWQKMLIDRQYLFYSEQSGRNILTMKEYFRQIMDGGSEDPSWNKDHYTKFVPEDKPNNEVSEIKVPEPPPAGEPATQEKREHNENALRLAFGKEPIVPPPPTNVQEALESDTQPWNTDDGYEDYESNYVDEEDYYTEIALPGEDPNMVPQTQQPTKQNVQYTEQTYTNLNLSPTELMSLCQTVYLRLNQHIFNKCGFDPTAATGFTVPAAITEPVPIHDIQITREDGSVAKAADIFVGMHAVNAEGKFTKDIPITTHIKGRIFDQSGLPAYDLVLNMNGHHNERRLVPQNINKNSKPAAATRQGHHIAWIIDNKNDTFKGSIWDGVYKPYINRN